MYLSAYVTSGTITYALRAVLLSGEVAQANITAHCEISGGNSEWVYVEASAALPCKLRVSVRTNTPITTEHTFTIAAGETRSKTYTKWGFENDNATTVQNVFAEMSFDAVDAYSKEVRRIVLDGRVVYDKGDAQESYGTITGEYLGAGFCIGTGTVSDNLVGMTCEISGQMSTSPYYPRVERITLGDTIYLGDNSDYRTNHIRVQLPNGTWIDGEVQDADYGDTAEWHFPLGGTYAQPMQVRVVHA